MEYGFWANKGLGEFPRWVLKICKASYKEVNPERQEWHTQIKPNSLFPFPNLPYLKDEDLLLTESQAIAFYVADKLRPELLGKTPLDGVRVRMIIQVFQDLFAVLWRPLYQKEQPHRQALEEACRERALPRLEQLAQMVGEQEWFLGYLTLADVYFGYLAYNFKVFCRSLQVVNPIDQLPKLSLLSQRVMQLEEIKAHVASDEFKKRPLIPDSYLPFKVLEDTE